MYVNGIEWDIGKVKDTENIHSRERERERESEREKERERVCVCVSHVQRIYVSQKWVYFFKKMFLLQAIIALPLFILFLQVVLYMI